MFFRLSRTRSRDRTGTGVNLLVFETNASTDSAIRAGVLFRLPVGVWLRIDVVRGLKA